MVNMLIKVLITLGLLFCNGMFVAQQTLIDSLSKSIDEGADIEKTFTFLEKQIKVNILNTTELVDWGYKKSVENNNGDWQVVFLLGKSRYELRKGDFEKSISMAYQGLELIKEKRWGTYREGQAHFLLARGLREIGAFKEAIDQRKSQLLWMDTAEYNLNIELIYSTIGVLFIELEETDSAIYYFQKVISYRDSFNKNTGSQNASMYNNIALAYIEGNKLDSAEKYFNRSYQYYSKGRTKTDSLMSGIVGANLTRCWDLNEREEEIIELINYDIFVSRKYESYGTLGRAYLAMADVFIAKEEHSQAVKFIDSALTVVKRMDNSVSTVEFKMKALLRLSKLHYQLQEFQKSYLFSEQYRVLHDSLFGKEMTRQLISSLSTYRVAGIHGELKLQQVLLKESEQKVKILETEEELGHLRMVLFGSIGGGVLLLSLFLILKMRSDHKKKRKMDELSRKLLEASNQNKTKRLTEATLSLTRKKEFAEALILKLSQIEGIEKRQLIPLKMFVDNELQMDNSIIEMEQYISELSKDFFVKIRIQFPQLTESDVRLCGLIRLNLTNKQIAIIKNITPESVKIAKNRLIKKLSQPPGTLLSQFLSSF